MERLEICPVGHAESILSSHAALKGSSGLLLPSSLRAGKRIARQSRRVGKANLGNTESLGRACKQLEARYFLSFQDCQSLHYLSVLSLQSLDRWEADFSHAWEKG